MRRTKIICTIGPSSEAPETLRAMIVAGMDVARLAMAHSSVEDGLERVRRIRAAATDVGRPVGILIDLPGPKLRAGPFDDDGVELSAGSSVELRVGDFGPDSQSPADAAGPGSVPEMSTASVIFIDHPELVSDLRSGDRIALGDGGVVIDVAGRQGDSLGAVVATGGVLRGRPAVHLPPGRRSVRSPTEEDLRTLDAFVQEGVDLVALSGVRSGSDMRRLGTEPHPTGPLLVAKIENRSAIDNLDGIIAESGAVMVARGDLGAECSVAELPHLQKEIIRRCIASGLPVITATQMLETMVTATSPTRAEASDVANAVIDGSSALMLSAETAIGSHPVHVIDTMSEIAKLADERFDHAAWSDRLEELHLSEGVERSSVITDALTSAAARACERLEIAAILAISGSGFTVRSMARFRPRALVVGVTTNANTFGQLTASWGTTPLKIDESGPYEDRVRAATQAAKLAGLIHTGDVVGVLAGIDQASAATDVFRIIRVS